MKDCTFNPKLNRKSEKILSGKDSKPVRSYELLHQKHQAQQDRAKKLLKEKLDKEMEECTFAPKVRRANYSKDTRKTGIKAGDHVRKTKADRQKY